MRTLDDVDLGDYDFLDFGTGDGASLRRAAELFGGRGLGIDIDRKKIARAQERGDDIVYGDITALPRRKTVRYVFMDNFLEHLPDYDLVQTMLDVAAAVAEEFVYVRHPSFEDEAYLASVGLKQYWHDWSGHPSHLVLPEFAAMFKKVGLGPVDVEYLYPASDSSDSSILPLDAPQDQHEYDATAHGDKPHIDFPRPVYRQIRLRAYVRGGGHRAAKSPPPDAGSVQALRAEVARLEQELAAAHAARGVPLRDRAAALRDPRDAARRVVRRARRRLDRG